MAKIGFIGLGIMGRPMAGHLLEGGHELFVHYPSRAAEGAGSTRALSLAPTARKSVRRPR